MYCQYQPQIFEGKGVLPLPQVDSADVGGVYDRPLVKH